MLSVFQKIFIVMKEELHLTVKILLAPVGEKSYSISESENVQKLS